MQSYHKYNAQNNYSMSLSRLQYWASRHKKAIKENDIETIQWIESMLTDINFHRECSLFRLGKYDEALKSFRGE